MARPANNAQPEKVFARTVTDLQRRVRALERRPDSEIAGIGGGGGGGPLGICSVGFSTDTDIKPKKRCWPFDTTVVNEGGFTINPAYVNGGNTGTAIEVPADGFYQFGIAGELDFSITNPVTTPANFTLMQAINNIELIASGASNFSIVSHRFIQQAIYGGSWNWLTDFEEIFGIISEPVELLAGDPIFTSLNLSGTFTVNSITAIGGAGTDWGVEMWVVRLA